MTKPKSPPCPTEYDEQRAVISWCRQYSRFAGFEKLAMVHGDSSGVRVPIGCALKMKKAGAIKGWPDLFLPVPLESQPGQYHCCGLFIELKRRQGGVVSREQKEIHRLLSKNGYRVEVCKGADAAIQAIIDYLGL